MALVLADRVKETSTTTGTGTYTLAGAVTGFESFGSIGNGNTTYYACTLGSDFEVGIGTYTASGTTLARTTILQSSNSDNAVDWGAGTKTLFCTQPAEKAVFRDASGHIIALDGRNLTNVDAATLDSIDSGSFLRSDAADTKTSGDLTFSDNVKAVFGAGSDLQIFHDGTNSRIYGTTGDTNIGQNAFGAVKLTGDNDQENMLVANVNGSVELYHDNSKKLETTSSGATVTGGLTANVTGDGTEVLRLGTERPWAFLQRSTGASASLAFRSTIDGKNFDIENEDGGLVARFIANNSTGSAALYHGGSQKFVTTSTGATVTGELAATSLDISGNVDVDGTLEADAMTLNGTAITSTATLSTGISNNNVPKFTSGVADNDFLRVDGTAIEGRSASEVLSDIGGISASSTDTLTNKTLTTPVINGFSGTGNGSITGDLTLTSTDAGSGEDPTLDLYRNSSSPADNDVIGHINFSGENSAGEKITYAEIQTSIADVTDGTEDSRLQLGARHNGTFLTYYEAKFGLNTFNRDAIFTNDTGIIFEGATNDGNETTLTVTDPTADRTITLPNATGTVSLLTNTETLTNKTLTTPVINGFSGTGDGSITGDLTLTSTDAGSTVDPLLKILRNSSSPANQDVLGGLSFQGKNNNSEFINYAFVQSRIRDVTDGSENGALETFVETDGSLDLYTVHQDGESQFYKDVQIISSDSGATENPSLTLYRNSASPADSDILGHINFSGENSAGEKIVYAEVESAINDQTDGTEDGEFIIRSMLNGTLTKYYSAGFGSNIMLKPISFTAGASTIFFEGTTNNTFETSFTVTDPTADRTITLPDATGTVQLTDGSGASLTSLNASQLSSGTVPNARLDAQLQDVAGLAVTNGGFIVGDGSNFVLETGSTARASLELGTAAVLDTGISNTNVPKFTSGVADNDFLRVDGTAIEGRSASEVLSDISAMPLAGGTFTGDVTFTGASYNVVFDISDDALEFADNAKATFGTGADLQIYHDGSNSYIDQNDATLFIRNTSETNNPSGNGIDIRNADNTGIEVVNNSGVIIKRSGSTSVSFTAVGAYFATDIILNGNTRELKFRDTSAGNFDLTLDAAQISGSDKTITLPNVTGTVLTTANSDTPTTTTSSSDADFVLVDDGGTMKKITPSNLGITSGGTTAAFATAMAMVL